MLLTIVWIVCSALLKFCLLYKLNISPLHTYTHTPLFLSQTLEQKFSAHTKRKKLELENKWSANHLFFLYVRYLHSIPSNYIEFPLTPEIFDTNQL